ncbi:MAG: RNA polymerase sigma factor [bacterium]
MEEEKLVEKLKNKDEEAFRIFMEQYKGIVYNIIYSVAGNSGDSDDIAQNVFITVFRKIHKFRGKSALSTWLYRITVNKCKDYFRKRKPTSELSENMPALHNGKGTETERAVNENLAKALLAGLPVKYRMPVVMRLEGFSYGEIAATLKISLEKVKIMIFRAKEKMRETLKKHEV